jgi:hypothetical protein
VQCKKQKDGELFADAEFRMTVQQLGHDDDGDAITSLVARHLSTEEERERAHADEVAAGRVGRNQALLTLLSSCTEEKSLRRAYYELLGVTLNTEAKNKAYHRALAEAKKSGHISDIIEGRIITRGGL